MVIAADHTVAFDMEALAKSAGSMISSSLLGGLAGSGALPFPKESDEDVIRASGRGVEASLRAFNDAFDCATGKQQPPQPEAVTKQIETLHVPSRHQDKWAHLQSRLAALPAAAQEMTGLGLTKVVDYQDLAYGEQYMDMVETLAVTDSAPFEMTITGAKYCTRALCHDDILRVADIKTRARRMTRVRDEVVVGGPSVDGDRVFPSALCRIHHDTARLAWQTAAQFSPSRSVLLALFRQGTPDPNRPAAWLSDALGGVGAAAMAPVFAAA